MTRKPCLIDGCDTPLTARGWCHFHYYRWKRWGDPEATGRISVCAKCDTEWVYSARGSKPHLLCPSCREKFSGCQMCRQIMPVEFFYRDAHRPSGINGRCKACSSEYSKVRNIVPKTAEQAERHRLKNRYGITPEQRQEMFDQQGGRCAICGSDEKLVVDHCHRQGTVRSLLCGKCNKGLGHFRDDPELLQKALEYLTLERVT